jgi:hypothetical protein
MRHLSADLEMAGGCLWTRKVIYRHLADLSISGGISQKRRLFLEVAHISIKEG